VGSSVVGTSAARRMGSPMSTHTCMGCVCGGGGEGGGGRLQ
jgi:hypothetical protein